MRKAAAYGHSGLLSYLISLCLGKWGFMTEIFPARVNNEARSTFLKPRDRIPEIFTV